MAGDGSGRGSEEDKSKTSERAAHIADHLIREAEKREEEEQEKK